jgi:hypothetical protein
VYIIFRAIALEITGKRNNGWVFFGLGTPQRAEQG